MSKKIIFFIVAAVVLVGAAIAAYFLFFQDRDDAGSDSADQAPPMLDASGTPVSIPGQGSTLITSGATGLSGMPGFSNLSEANLSASNVLTSPGSNPAKIHFTRPFNSNCDPFVWYKNWLYEFVESTQDSNTGTKTCYYAVNKSKLPTELLVATPASGTCTNFKLYISGTEYKYDSKRAVKFGVGTVDYCVYKK